MAAIIMCFRFFATKTALMTMTTVAIVVLCWHRFFFPRRCNKVIGKINSKHSASKRLFREKLLDSFVYTILTRFLPLNKHTYMHSKKIYIYIYKYMHLSHDIIQCHPYVALWSIFNMIVYTTTTFHLRSASKARIHIVISN